MKVFSEIGRIKAIDPDGKKFDQVSRALITSESSQIYLDYHSGLFVPKPSDSVEIALYSNRDGFDHNSIPQKFGYVMCGGVIYRQEPEGAANVLIEISFSGLLMQLVIPKEALFSTEAHREFFVAARIQ